jgi:hypothetical protein
MIKVLIILALSALLSISADAQLLLLDVGGGGFSGTPAVNCGTGVLDFSSGCAPMLRGV